MSFINPISSADNVDSINRIGAYGGYNSFDTQAKSSDTVSPDNQSSPADCKTCKERKYKDGSDEMVSFKSAAHISPQASASAVRSHEQEHVSNAYKKAAQGNGDVISANVSLRTAVCPECGRSYVSGGTTSTQIKYINEDNPYQKDLKLTDSLKYSGRDINRAV